MQKEKKIIIIGAGVSGLITALELEKEGFSPLIVESSDRVGGRLKTDLVNGVPLDHGFQVLLEAYPMVSKYLNLDSLNLKKLVPGALIYTDDSKMLIGDPLRDFKLFFPTLFAKVGSLIDKIKIFRLNLELKNTSIEAIFNTEQITTKEYLLKKGFSTKIIEQFFKPFFTGIFLETELETSSVMFQFIYKMFGEGLAVIPQDGIEAIPKQLKAQLNKTTFQFNTPVKTIEDNRVILENGTSLKADIIVCAASTSHLGLTPSHTSWKSCQNLYFEVENNPIKRDVIGLIASKKALINNIYIVNNERLTSKPIISVTVVKSHNLSELDLVKKVEEDLWDFCKIKTTRFIKHYNIKQALPNIKDVKNTINPKDFKLSNNVYAVGDVVLNGSLNAAMKSGELVAHHILKLVK